MRVQLNEQVAQGKDRDEVYQQFISIYGSQGHCQVDEKRA